MRVARMSALSLRQCRVDLWLPQGQKGRCEMRRIALVVLAVMVSAPGLASEIVRTSAPRLSQGRDRLAATSVGNYAIFAGGRTGPGPYDKSARVDIYDASSGLPPTEPGAWLPPQSLSQARSHIAATTLGAKAFFAGGGEPVPPDYEYVVDIYDSSLGDPTNPAAWSTHVFTQGGAGMAATTVGNMALFAGGNNQGTYRTGVEIYDASSDTWSFYPDALSQARGFLSATTVAGRWAIFAGGEYGHPTYSSAVDIYDCSLGPPTDSGAWLSPRSLSQARSDMAAVLLCGEGFFAGGGGPSGTAAVDIFDTSLTVRLDTLSQARYGLAGTTLGSIGMFGGGSGFSNVVDLYSGATGWSTAPPLSEGRYFLAATTVGNYALFAGGYGNSGYSDIVDVYTIQTQNRHPVARCQDVTASADDNCQANIAPGDVDNGSFDPDGDPITLTLDPAGPYPLGETQVTLTVTDDKGASSDCTATITVVDDTAPYVLCPGDITVSNDPGESGAVVDYEAPDALDNCDMDVEVICEPPSGSMFPIGETEVVCTAIDDAGNQATCFFIVTVELMQDIRASIRFSPRTLNLRSAGKWVTCSIALPEGYDVGDIDTESIRLEGELAVCSSSRSRRTLRVKFDRQELVAYIESLGIDLPADVELVVSGQLSDGTKFEGNDTIRVTGPGMWPHW